MKRQLPTCITKCVFVMGVCVIVWSLLTKINNSRSLAPNAAAADTSLIHHHSASNDSGYRPGIFVTSSPSNVTMPDIINIISSTPGDHSQLVEFLTQPIINPHHYGYILNKPQLCTNHSRPTSILFVVPSAPGNLGRRERVRSSDLYAFTKHPSNNASLLFFLGRPVQRPLAGCMQAMIEEENRKYGDLVQQDFTDKYRNIRLKAVSMLQWAATFCHTADYVIRTDDDVIASPRMLIRAIRRLGEEHQNFVVGKVERGWPVVHDNRWVRTYRRVIVLVFFLQILLHFQIKWNNPP